MIGIQCFKDPCPPKWWIKNTEKKYIEHKCDTITMRVNLYLRARGSVWLCARESISYVWIWRNEGQFSARSLSLHKYLIEKLVVYREYAVRVCVCVCAHARTHTAYTICVAFASIHFQFKHMHGTQEKGKRQEQVKMLKLKEREKKKRTRKNCIAVELVFYAYIRTFAWH